MSPYRPSTCEACGDPLPEWKGGPGRPRRFCRDACADAHSHGINVRASRAFINQLNEALANQKESHE